MHVLDVTFDTWCCIEYIIIVYFLHSYYAIHTTVYQKTPHNLYFNFAIIN